MLETIKRKEIHLHDELVIFLNHRVMSLQLVDVLQILSMNTWRIHE
jgi:hypothetical protein